MNRLVQKWEEVHDDLGVDIVAPFSVDIGNNVTIHAELLVKNFGARNGMLVVTDYASIKPYTEQLIALGYGFSVLDEPTGYECYDRESIIRMLSDWTWSGPMDTRPSWIIDVAD